MAIIVESYQRMRGNVKDIILSTTQAQIDDYESRIKDRNEEFEKTCKVLKQHYLQKKGKSLY